MSTSKTTNVLIFSILFMLLASGVCASVIYTVGKMGGELKLRAQAIADNSAKIRTYKELLTQYKETADKRSQLDAFVLTENEVGGFLTEIERIGTAQNIHITTNSLKIDKKPDTSDKLLVQFGLIGNEENVRRMLTLLESLPYPSTLTALTLSHGKDTPTESTVDISVTLVKHD